VYIEQCVKQLAQVESESGPATEALLFLGNWHDSIPRLLWRDPILEAIDVRVWGIIMTCAHAQNATAFPSYDEIARLANVARGTVARAMMILRTTRWISVCGRIHDHQGRYRGNIYVLHDEPVSLADTIHLDHGYMQFLHRTTQHKHPRVRKVARAVLATEAGTPLLDNRLGPYQTFNIGNELPDGVEVEGYPGLEVLRWSGELQAGRNGLTLPLIGRRAGAGGVLKARIHYQDAQRELTIPVQTGGEHNQDDKSAGAIHRPDLTTASANRGSGRISI
jgi:hypothetical protein